MEVEEVPLLEFPRHTKVDHSNPRNNGSPFEIRIQLNSLSVNYPFSWPFPHTVIRERPSSRGQRWTDTNFHQAVGSLAVDSTSSTELHLCHSHLFWRRAYPFTVGCRVHWQQSYRGSWAVSWAAQRRPI